MSEFYGDDISFQENIILDVKDSRYIHWINKSNSSLKTSELAEHIISKWAESNIQTIAIINTLEYTAIIALSLNNVWTAMNEYKKINRTTPETLVLVNNNDFESPARIIENLVCAPLLKYSVPYEFPINWTKSGDPESIVLPSINDNNIYRCYKLSKPISINDAGNLIRSGDEYNYLSTK